MAKTIQKGDIIVDGHLQNAISEAKKYIKLIDQLDTKIIKLGTDLEAALKVNEGNSLKTLQELNRITAETTKIRKDAAALDKEKVKLDQELEKLNQQKNKTIAEEFKAEQQLGKAISENEKSIQQQNKSLQEQEKLKQQKLTTQKKEQQLLIQQKKEVERLNNVKNKELAQAEKLERKRQKAIRDEERENNAYFKLTKSTNAAQAEFKKLAAQYGINSKQAIKARLAFEKVDRELREINNTAKDGRRDVGRYGLALKGAAGGLKNLASGLGVVGGVMLLNKVMRATFDIVSNFGQAQADLASVLAVNTDEMAALTAQAKELGATTKFTASEVSNLQLEFAKLGFTQEEIQNVTESTLQLAAASGTDLANAATIVGSTLRGFNKDASETQALVDIMAKSFSSSSLDIDKFASAMSSVAPVANNAGVSMERTTALIGTLTDRGIDASTAGTGLRNMFLAAAESGKTFEDLLAEVAGATDQTAKALELFGKRGATLGVILAQNGVSVDALTNSLENAGGAAKEMADKQLDTLNGQLSLLNSAWGGYILGTDGATGASEGLKTIISFLAENLAEILGLVGRTVALWSAYKVAVKAAKLITADFTKTIKVLGKEINLTKKATGAWSLALTAVVMIAVELYNRIQAVESATDKMNKVTEKTNELLSVEKDKLNLVKGELFATAAASEERQAVLDKINAEYGTTLQNLEDEAEFANQIAKAYKDIVAEMDKKIGLQVIETELLDATAKVRELQREIDDLGILDVASQSLSTVIGDNLFQQLETEKEFIKELHRERIELQNTDLNGDKLRIKSTSNRIDQHIREEDKKTENDLKNTDKVEKAKDQSDIEEELRFKQRQQRNKDEADQEKENIKTLLDLEKQRQKEIDEINKQQEKDDQNRLDAEKKRISELKKANEELKNKIIKSIDEISKAKQDKIDSDIENSRDEIEASRNEIQRLNELGTANSALAIQAEEKRIANEKLEIDALERKKRNLLLTTVALERAGQLIGSGNLAPFKTAGSDLVSFISSLPTFYNGAEGTFAETLGKTGTKDGHAVRVDDGEQILNGKKVDSLRAVGLRTTTDITNAAIMHQTHKLESNALKSDKVGGFNDRNIVNKLDKAIKAFKSLEFPVAYTNPNTGTTTIEKGNTIKRINHNFNPYST